MNASYLDPAQREQSTHRQTDGYLLAVALNLLAVLILIGAIAFLITRAIGPADTALLNVSPNQSSIGETGSNIYLPSN